jgi:hypothetical protein
MSTVEFVDWILIKLISLPIDSNAFVAWITYEI